MEKASPPLLGYNNNVRHRGRTFHIQTEDSGTRYGRVVTHLFADGGRIVKTTRTEYVEHLGAADLVARVRVLMKEQHKAMFVALRQGDLDGLVERMFGDTWAPPDDSMPLSQKPRLRDEPQPSLVLTSIESLEPASTRLVEPVGAAPISHPGPTLSERVEARLLGEVPLPPAPRPAEVAVATAVTPEKLIRPSNRPPQRASNRPPHRPSNRPKKNLTNPSLRRPQSLSPLAFQGEVPLDTTGLEALSQTSPPSLLNQAPPERASDPSKRPSNLPPRLTAARPATSFGKPPRPESRSIFGDSSISEQSLDEVILSYLEDDLGEQ